MDVLWRVREPSSVRDVHTELAIHRDLAYTTVMTVLDRLAKKSLVSRVRQGRQWLYSPAQSRVDLMADEVIDLVGNDPGVREAVLGEVLRRLPVSERRGLLRRLTPRAAS